ncbi:DUF1642 domain-containing protein [Enterococcus faecium]|uniref:DUF1642 domain-containing protein n=1 Tax=Enterococcus TaxID=1350 RepID=UPI00032F08A7|nr:MULTISPECIES: DUF1642 domain-containing protein [Enterococcus]EGP5615954.1 DUF1642 domain-containing protein [Enterococcus faecium]EME7156027.1 DUF1642 domain-containing protein [Enterococcus faecium]EME8178259.1 DUF1642 domain-containing protein [Enterococcus faecium]EMF0412704.1 DUF1642 domain-containing protein [Enterococcus faecium]EMF0586917.1 DUF1642 domain-containing protein [Enterococcus faecium]
MNKQELIETLEKLNKYSKRCIGIDKHEDYWRGKTDAYFNLIGLVKQLDEPKKLVIPQLVAGWLEKSTDPFTKAEKIAYLIKSKDGDSYYFCDWFVRDGIVTQEQGEELLAWVTRQSYETLLSLYNGYEVEKEPLYYVRLPYEVWDEEAAELKTEYLYLHYEITSDETRIFPTKEPRKGFVTKLDELTIKSADERFWPFAVPVEEVVER